MVKLNESLEFDNIGPFYVTNNDLPISCPLPEMALWNAHPRVYLPIVETGNASCPYCGAEYILREFEESKVIKEV
jgi:uncharacterized Zn-finger protein